jgi:hypothetical protein
MSESAPAFHPYDNDRRIGSITEISASFFKGNLTLAGQGSNHFVHGNPLNVGELNEYVFIDAQDVAILGRVTKVWLDGAERLSVDEINNKPQNNHPIGSIQPLVSVKPFSGDVERGISRFPRLGAQIYAAHPDWVAHILGNKSKDNLDLALGQLPNKFTAVTISASPEQLFTKHCAILGSTGSGKSNTVAKLLELIAENGGKAILIDATGEYKKLENCESVIVGTEPKEVVFPYWELPEMDLCALLRPSSAAQMPKLLAAIQSLKANWSTKEAYIKAGTEIATFKEAVSEIKANTLWHFEHLATQIEHECVWPTGGTAANPKYNIFGNKNDSDLANCITLISRIKTMNDNDSMKWLIVNPLEQSNLRTIKNAITSFIESKESERILRLDLSKVPFASNAREILVNAIGRCLLDLARNPAKTISIDKPLLVFIDEAHQFLNKSTGDEYSKITLDAFGNIAKEGRKYGLNVVIATQRPRDIPEDVLSQMGTFLVHRLINPIDQDLIKKAIGDLDSTTAQALPTLATGEVLLLGVDFNFPMRIKIKKADVEIKSASTNFSKVWKENKDRQAKS